MKFASLFSGFGLADIGAMQAGYAPVYACEIDPQIADVYRRNIGDHVQVCDVREADVPTDVDLLHASPVCKSFSRANTSGKEHADDIATAQATADIIRRVRPRAVTVENVRAYAKSESLRRITAALDELGYWWVTDILDASDYGVPQNRVRLILRARRDGMMIAPIAESTERLSWDGAIADLIDDLPDTQLARWQLKRMPELRGGGALVDGSNGRGGTQATTIARNGAPSMAVTVAGSRAQRILVARHGADLHRGGELDTRLAGIPSPTVMSNRGTERHNIVLLGSNQSEFGKPMRNGGSPALSVTGQHAGRQRILVDGRNGRSDTGAPTIARSGELAMTQTAGARLAHRIIDGYTVKAVTPRCMARWQTLPDTYDLPPTKSLAATGIGNGVPCELYRRVAASMTPAGKE